MSNNINKKVVLIGTGYMGAEYAKVLEALKLDYEVIGRGEDSAKRFENLIGKKPIIGGIENWLENDFSYSRFYYIVAVGVEKLADITIRLLRKGAKYILVEKPAGLNRDEIGKVAMLSEEKKANVFIAYNRRFYASVFRAKEIIKEDCGVTSFNFEFTEWSHEIEKLMKPKKVLENWFLANSTHVVDLAFYLGGQPKEITCYTAGSLKWHPSSSVFNGAGITEKQALFSYQANWEAPGRWGIEVLTKKHRLILRPLEKLQIQNIGSVETKFVDIDDELDIKFKPGLYQMVNYFINENYILFQTIAGQYKSLSVFKKISNEVY